LCHACTDMPDDSDFAALLNSETKGPRGGAVLRLKRGQVVDGTIVQVTPEFVYVDVGGPVEARVATESLLDSSGQPRVSPGDRLRALVLDARMEAPVLGLEFGRGRSVSASELQIAREAQMPVKGKVSRALKGGLEVEISGWRAFCPASQIETSYVRDLAVYEGQELEFLVLEIRNAGRDVVVSRRALLEAQQREAEADAVRRLAVGQELDGVVTALTRHGAVVDLGGVEGFLHVSELANRYVRGPEEVLQVDARIKVTVLSIDSEGAKRRIRLSLLPATDQPVQASKSDEILSATVVRAVAGGLIVQTARGDGFVPVRELALAPGADFRRAFPPGRELQVVAIHNDVERRRITFSVRGVEAVEEHRNFEAFGASNCSSSPTSLGSLGDILQKSLKDQSGSRVPRQTKRR